MKLNYTTNLNLTTMPFVRKSGGGFVALITAIILSLILMIVTVTLNQSGFFTRSTLLDSEYKERSAALAEACVDVAKLKLANDPAYPGNETVSIGPDTCNIRLILFNNPVSGQNTIETRGVYNKASTNLRVVIYASTFIIISWDEIPSFP